MGFEPTVRITYAGFQDRSLRPLDHLSTKWFNKNCMQYQAHIQQKEGNFSIRHFLARFSEKTSILLEKISYSIATVTSLINFIFLSTIHLTVHFLFTSLLFTFCIVCFSHKICGTKPYSTKT